MLVPLAHASIALGNSKSFIASLCIGNKIVSVDFDLSHDDDEAPISVANAISKCPLCSITELVSPINKTLETAVHLQQDSYRYTPYKVLLTTTLSSTLPIRAPPVIT